MDKKVVLLVEDEPDIQKFTVFALKEQGFEVIQAFSGKEALSLAKEKKIDIILLDIMMPGIDGYVVCKKLGEDPKTKDIPVIILSALVQKKEIEKGYKKGAIGYITKPFDPMKLGDKIKGILKKWEKGK